MSISTRPTREANAVVDGADGVDGAERRDSRNERHRRRLRGGGRNSAATDSAATAVQATNADLPDPDLREHDVHSASTAQLVTRAVDQVTLIFRQELALARAEAVQKAKRAGIGSGLLVCAVVVAFVAMLCMVGAAVAGFANVLPAWAAALIVAGILLAGAGLAALIGIKALRKASPSTPPDVVASIKADVAEIKEHMAR